MPDSPRRLQAVGRLSDFQCGMSEEGQEKRYALAIYCMFICLSTRLMSGSWWQSRPWPLIPCTAAQDTDCLAGHAGPAPSSSWRGTAWERQSGSNFRCARCMLVQHLSQQQSEADGLESKFRLRAAAHREAAIVADEVEVRAKRAAWEHQRPPARRVQAPVGVAPAYRCRVHFKESGCV